MQTAQSSGSVQSSSTRKSRIELVDCMDSARLVMTDPGVVDDISEDGAVGTFPVGPIYLTGFVGTEIIACFVMEKTALHTANVHVQVLPKHREKYAEEFGREALAWTWANTDLEKLVAEIPTTHPNVLDFAERMGFEIEGLNRRSLKKGGRLVHQWYVGLVKGETDGIHS